MTDQSPDPTAAIREALKSVLDPELMQDLVTLDMVKAIGVTGSTAKVTVELTTPACPLKKKIEDDVRAAVTAVPGIDAVEVKFTSRVRGAPAIAGNPIPGVKNTIAVASGKGGVGKSTVAVNVAAALVREGARVGLLDCDIYGPSVPTMTGTVSDQPSVGEAKLEPLMRHGLKLMSIGYLIDPKQPVVWRGPLIHKAIQQFIHDVNWGDLDYLLIDLPPGTGDAQLSLSQMIPLTGAVIVTTPQEISLIDVRRGAAMFGKVNVTLLGVIENMSGFACPHCSEVTKIFDEGGGERVAKELDIPFLGAVPLDLGVRRGGDEGTPSVITHPDAESTAAFVKVARYLAGRVSQLNVGGAVGFRQALPVLK
jgi:ATP-binding protein involved in chromosome partitioning